MTINLAGINNILVAEDEKMLRELLSFHLFEAGFNVLEAEDGEEAIEIFASNSIDLIITDIRMPRVNGRDLLQQVVSQANIPVIVFTGFNDVPAHILRHEGAQVILQKPLDMNELIETIISRNSKYNPDQLSGVKLLQRKVTLQTEGEQNHLHLGRDGAYIQTCSDGYQRGDSIRFELDIVDCGIQLEGFGEVYFINDEKFEPKQELRGLMIDFYQVNLSREEYLALVPEDTRHCSIPYISSNFDEGIKDAV